MGVCASAEDRPEDLHHVASSEQLAPGSDTEPHSTRGNRTHASNGAPSGRSPSSSPPTGSSLANQRREAELKLGITKFNLDAKKGIRYLVDRGIIEYTAEDVAHFLSAPRLFLGRDELQTGLSTRQVGDYLARVGSQPEDQVYHERLLHAFMERLNMREMDIEDAMRQWLALCAFPGEAQVVERLTRAFAERYVAENGHAFASVDAAYFLATQLFMVNTMLHNPNAGHTATITADAFSRILRTEPDGAELDDAYLRAKFNSIKATPFSVTDQTDVIAFFNPLRKGWLEKRSHGAGQGWVRRYFLLNDHCLYYFSRPEAVARGVARCIIPLENCSATAMGEDRLRIASLLPSGSVKAAKRLHDGTIVQGIHAAYELRAVSRVVRDAWLRAIRLELAASPFQVEVESRRVQQQARTSRRGRARALTRTADKLEGLRATLAASAGEGGNDFAGAGDGAAPVGTEGLHRVMRRVDAPAPAETRTAPEHGSEGGGERAGAATEGPERAVSDGEAAAPSLSPPRRAKDQRRRRRSSSPPPDQGPGAAIPPAPLSASRVGHARAGDAKGLGEEEEERGRSQGAESEVLSSGAVGVSPYLAPRTPTRRQWRGRHLEAADPRSESLPLFQPPESQESGSFRTLSEAQTEGSDVEPPARGHTARVNLYDLVGNGSLSDEEAGRAASGGGRRAAVKAAPPPTVSLHLVSLVGAGENEDGGNGEDHSSTGSGRESFETCEDVEALRT